MHMEDNASGVGIDRAMPDFLVSRTWDRSLWKSLLVNVSDRVFPERLPPLEITSRPVDVGMLIGDFVSLPWFRTVFTNLGDVISPETLPPLRLESRPVDVGELIADQLSHPWWSSLLRNLADRIAPEQQAALELTSSPFDVSLSSGAMQIDRWSSLIAEPEFVPRPRMDTGGEIRPPAVVPEMPVPRFGAAPSASVEITDSATPSHEHAHAHGRLVDALLRSRLRERLLIAAAILEAVYLLACLFGFF